MSAGELVLRHEAGGGIAPGSEPAPFVVEVVSSSAKMGRTALRGKKPYLARLLASGGRVWAKREKRGTRRVFALPAYPGDVFEGRWAHWNSGVTDGEAGEMESGTRWWMLGPGGTYWPLTREQAHTVARGMPMIETVRALMECLPDNVRLEAIPPAGLYIAELS